METRGVDRGQQVGNRDHDKIGSAGTMTRGRAAHSPKEEHQAATGEAQGDEVVKIARERLHSQARRDYRQDSGYFGQALVRVISAPSPGPALSH